MSEQPELLPMTPEVRAAIEVLREDPLHIATNSRDGHLKVSIVANSTAESFETRPGMSWEEFRWAVKRAKAIATISQSESVSPKSDGAKSVGE